LFTYKDQDTGVVITAGNFNAVCSKVFHHRTANRLDPVSDVTIEDNCCHRIIEAGHGQVVEDSEYDFIPMVNGLHIGLADIIRGSTILLENRLAGNPKVNKAVAEGRAAICVLCQFNVEPEGCTGCNAGRLREWAEKVGGRNEPTQYDSQLKSCYHCSCFNKLQIWYPLDILQKYINSTVNDNLPGFCWKKRT
jgi:hypothetical protein